MSNLNTATFRRHNPIIYWVSWVFVLVNYLFGISLFLYSPKVSYIIVNHVFSFKFYGILFLILATAGLIATLTNKHKIIRVVLSGGLILKVFWEFALLVRAIRHPEVLITLAMWTALAATQLIIVLFFPEDNNGKT